jgi:hypothetical protein
MVFLNAQSSTGAAESAQGPQAPSFRKICEQYHCNEIFRVKQGISQARLAMARNSGRAPISDLPGTAIETQLKRR